MMAGNPNWWSMQSSLRSSSSSSASDHQQEAANLFISQTHHHPNNNNSLLPLQFLHGSSSSSTSSSSLLPFSSLADHHHGQDFPHSWSQLLLGGLGSEQEERFGPSLFQATRMMNNGHDIHDVKQEVSNQSNNNNNNLYGHHQHHHHHHEEQDLVAGVSNRTAACWSQSMPTSSPKSCITSLSSNNNINNNNNNINNNDNILDFSTTKRSLQVESHQHADQSNSECNSTATGGIPKKPRVQSSSIPPLKVRKEKLGDRITALHQLVSPFGKTDTASVLLEAIGYIRFLQGQIEALSSPYLANNNASANSQPSLLNDSCLKRRGAANYEDIKDATKDLKSRGLCLVPISCTQLVGSDNGADYWAPSFGGGF